MSTNRAIAKIAKQNICSHFGRLKKLLITQFFGTKFAIYSGNIALKDSHHAFNICIYVGRLTIYQLTGHRLHHTKHEPHKHGIASIKTDWVKQYTANTFRRWPAVPSVSSTISKGSWNVFNCCPTFKKFKPT